MNETLILMVAYSAIDAHESAWYLDGTETVVEVVTDGINEEFELAELDGDDYDD